MQFHLMLNILLLAMLWGPSFLFTKFCMTELSPLTVVTARLGISALVLFLILRLKNIPLPRDPKLWKQCFIMGIFASAAPFSLFAFSILYIDTGLSALINGTTPILTVILANYFLKDEPLSLNRVVGIGLGLCGFLTLFLPSILTNGISGDVLGMLMSFGAAVCYAIGMVYARKNITFPSQKLTIPTMQLLTATFYMVPLAYFIDPPLDIAHLSVLTLSSISGLAIVGTVFAFIMYYRIVMLYGATALSTVTYILPLFSMTFGVIFLDESISLTWVLASFLILLGTMVANGVIPLKLIFRSVPA
jgi:drug/metabolite transporter (DMT)-like permease